MGNKLCKKKVDSIDTVDNSKSPTPFDRIITRLHLRPNSWKSDSHLNQKQVNRYEVTPSNKPLEKISNTQLLSKSTDWTEVDLEVPSDEPIHLRNPKLSVIFNNNEGTPTPPPRKHKKGIIREKIEAVAKRGLQAFESKKPVEEPLFIKKTINYKCPICDEDEENHNRDHHHHPHLHHQQQDKKASKRRKNLSVVSLPNYNDLKLTVAHFDEDIIDTKKNEKNSMSSLPNESKKLSTFSASTGKLDNYITRCRSFGSLLPQQLLEKLRTSRKIAADIESDDSFGALEDWDLGIIEHYNPKDASLPRARKLPNKDVLSDIENLIVQEEEDDLMEKPKPPIRRSESLVKRMNREKENAAAKKENVVVVEEAAVAAEEVEHSSLMKILEEFSIKDKQNQVTMLDGESVPFIDNDDSDHLNYANKEKHKSSIGDFIQAEKINSDTNLV